MNESGMSVTLFIAIWIFFLSRVNGMYIKIDKDRIKGGDKACL